ncbi:MAG: tetraacyldisaccharide 4'-kinase [Janthinobacterium lividum]
MVSFYLMEHRISSIQKYLLEAIAEPGRPGFGADLTRGFLGGLAGLYEAGLEGYLAAERVGVRRRERLPVRVISVGNLTVGGTGKTPMTQLLCRRLTALGKRVAVLSRGHGGASQSVRLVSDTEGHVLLTASEAGDEPVLLARTLPGVPVLVGKDRRQSGREALRRFDLDVLVLDDGFQFWQLARDLDIVLLDARRPFDNGFPLPRGLLREPMRHLSRAGGVVVTRSGGLSLSERAALTDSIFSLAPAARVFFADHQAVGILLADALNAPVQPLSELSGKRVFAVSAIAQPQSFIDTLTRDTSAVVVGHKAWADHQALTVAQAQTVMDEAVRSGAEAIVMTEKDAVKWPFSANADLPLYALRLEMAVDDEVGFTSILP